MEHTILWEEELRGGQTWSHIFDSGMSIRLTDVEGGANVSALMYNSRHTEERYNMPDTLKAQHIARLTEGFCIYSDMGHVMWSMTHDTAGWHDPLGGVLDDKTLAKKYGVKTYQEHRNEWTQAPKEQMLLELAKYSLGPRDWIPSLNLFSKVEVGPDGVMRYVPGDSKAGSYVELRAEMRTLLVLNANHHPLDPGSVYAPKPVMLTVKRVPPAGADDKCRLSRPENGRGFELNARCCS